MGMGMGTQCRALLNTQLNAIIDAIQQTLVRDKPDPNPPLPSTNQTHTCEAHHVHIKESTHTIKGSDSWHFDNSWH